MSDINEMNVQRIIPVDIETEMKKWKKGWKFKPELVLEERHRRKFPYPDDELRSRLNQFKLITNR